MMHANAAGRTAPVRALPLRRWSPVPRPPSAYIICGRAETLQFSLITVHDMAGRRAACTEGHNQRKRAVSGQDSAFESLTLASGDAYFNTAFLTGFLAGAFLAPAPAPSSASSGSDRSDSVPSASAAGEALSRALAAGDAAFLAAGLAAGDRFRRLAAGAALAAGLALTGLALAGLSAGRLDFAAGEAASSFADCCTCTATDAPQHYGVQDGDLAHRLYHSAGQQIYLDGFSVLKVIFQLVHRRRCLGLLSFHGTCRLRRSIRLSKALQAAAAICASLRLTQGQVKCT